MNRKAVDRGYCTARDYSYCAHHLPRLRESATTGKNIHINETSNSSWDIQLACLVHFSWHIPIHKAQ